MIRVGSFVFTTDQGLGYLAKDFYENGVVTDVLVVAHGRRIEHPEWYPGASRVEDLHSDVDVKKMEAFCESMDVMLFFETPFRWLILDYCRQRGVKTILVPMHECMPSTLPAIPDVMACPSDLDFKLYHQKKWAEHALPECDVTRCLVPVPDHVKWKRRTEAKVFVHNAGNGGLKGRNGTLELLEACNYIQSQAEIVIRSQEPISNIRGSYKCLRGPNLVEVDFRIVNFDRNIIYDDGDVFVFPEMFNGLSLPLQEAYASGMSVMATDRFPNNTYLPQEPLIPSRSSAKERISPRLEEYDRAVVDPRDLAEKIDEWYGRDISELSERGREWSESMSWKSLRPKWQNLIERLVFKWT